MGEVISRLKSEPIRNVFPREAHDFTRWLEENIELLSERIGIELSVLQREKEVGDFQVDLLCEDQDGRIVIIENQLEKTDHDHLGKLLTYLVNLDASTAIWIVTEPRVEHQKVINWLNESTPADTAFYLVRVETVRIDNSPIAPLFTVMSRPTQQTKEVGQRKKEWAEQHVKRLEFWTQLLEKCNRKTTLFSNISPGRYHWIGTGAGKSGITYSFVIRMSSADVELYIDHDRETGEKNKVIFDALYKQKDNIEVAFGDTLEWQCLEDKRACRICRTFTNGGLADRETWSELQEQMIDAMIRLEKAMRYRLKEIQV